MSGKKPSEKLTLKHIIGYGCGDAGGVVTLYAVSGFLSRFLQVNLGVNAGVLATMLLIWNIWDSVNDPMMGVIMDKAFAKAKPGADKFRPWILASIPIIMFGMIATFAVPTKMGGGVMMLVSVFVLKIVYEAGYTMMNIGMGSLLGNMAKDDTERATLASARGMGSTVGGLVGGIVIPQILARYTVNGNVTNEGYSMLGVVCAIIAGIIIFLHYFLTEERNKTVVDETAMTAEEKEAQKVKISDIFTIIRTNRAFLALVLHSISVCAVQAIGQGAATYIYMDVLKNVGVQSVGSGLSSGLMIAILLAGPILTKKWDLVKIIRVCLITGAVGFVGLLAYSLLAADMFVAMPLVFVVWNAIAAAFVTMSVQMQWGLVAEAIDYNEYLTGKRNEGTIYGFFSLSRRIGSTIANSATVLVIAGIGYDASLTQAGLDQAASTVTGLKLMVVGMPAIAAVISWACFTFIWNINGDVRAKMAAWKAEKTVKAN